MGAGDLAAGDTPAGEDAIASTPAPRLVTLPAAIQYDGATDDYRTDANGRYLESHPVDQRIALKLLKPLGSIASSPDTGSTFKAMPRLPTVQRRRWVETTVRTLLKPDIAAGDIELISIEVDTTFARGATPFRVSYVNLRLPGKAGQRQTQTVRSHL